MSVRSFLVDWSPRLLPVAAAAGGGGGEEEEEEEWEWEKNVVSEISERAANFTYIHCNQLYAGDIYVYQHICIHVTRIYMHTYIHAYNITHMYNVYHLYIYI
jgi:hypothetical protein